MVNKFYQGLFIIEDKIKLQYPSRQARRPLLNSFERYLTVPGTNM